MSWRLEKLAINDILAFCGLRELDLANQAGDQACSPDGQATAPQVIWAPNHTGKTSLALAILWGLSGVLPNLSRWNLRSFRMTNRMAGEDADPYVHLNLVNPAGDRLRIERPYRVTQKLADAVVGLKLVLQSDDGQEQVWSDTEAQDQLQLQLGLAADSLAAAGVVLQDQRLALVGSSEVGFSDVMNDVLGLETLSELQPLLNRARLDASRLHKECETYRRGADPLRRWNEEELRLAQRCRDLEMGANAAGVESSDLEDPISSLQTEFRSIAKALGQTEQADGLQLRASRGLGRELRGLQGQMRTGLQGLRQRKASKHAAQHESEKDQGNRLARLKADRELSNRWVREHADLLATSEKAGWQLGSEHWQQQTQECQAELTRLEQTRATRVRERGLLNAAFDHLCPDHDSDSETVQEETESSDKPSVCPVCAQSIDADAVVDQLRERLDQGLVLEMKALEKNERELRTKVSEARTASSQAAVRERSWSDLWGRVKKQISASDSVHSLQSLQPCEGRSEAPARAFGAWLERYHAALNDELTKLEAASEKHRRLASQAWTQVEEGELRPIETRLNRLDEFLMPLVQAQSDLEVHGEKRASAEAKERELQAFADRAEQRALDLKALFQVVSQTEEAHAEQTVLACEPQVTEFFRRVTGNPLYTDLSFGAAIKRGKLAYALRARSKEHPQLEDHAGHVLSEGDLSAAAIALLVGLASKQAHQLGFLVLDDPAQGLDATLAANLACELSSWKERPQLLVLTHQADFAKHLTDAGATQISLPEDASCKTN